MPQQPESTSLTSKPADLRSATVGAVDEGLLMAVTVEQCLRPLVPKLRDIFPRSVHLKETRPAGNYPRQRVLHRRFVKTPGTRRGG